MKLSVITPTCDRPEAFALAEAWMRRQTVQPYEWIVADGGSQAAQCSMGQSVIRMPSEPGPKNFTANLWMALIEVAGDAVVVVENDDWYSPRHLEAIQGQLELPDCVAAGDPKQRYYHVGHRRYRVMDNVGSSLCQTGFRVELAPMFQEAVREAAATGNGYGVDRAFWNRVMASGQKHSLIQTRTAVGMKGLPGLRGLGIGHRDDVVQRWTPDADGSILRDWIGDDADAYEAYRLKGS